MLQFITNGKDEKETVDQIREVVDGGCSWVQIRMKKSPPDAIVRVIEAVSAECKERNVKIIVDDHVEIARRPDVAGVHLGQTDMSPKEAREVLGQEKIIGLTINSLEQAECADTEPVDYYGVGPWRYTTTKEKLAPVLGPKGVKDIITRLKQDHPERSIVVIGGVRCKDIKDILAIGADGIAVSGALTLVKDSGSAADALLKELKLYARYE